MKIPRVMMGVDGNNLINNLAAQATAKGLPVKVSDIINVQVKLGGSIKNPIIKTDLKQTATSLVQDLKQQATAFVQNKIDSTKAAVTSAIKDTIKAVKNQVIKDVKNEVIKNVFGSKDSTQEKVDPKKRVEEAGKNLLKDLNPFK
jgi:alanyl-tRNA synthetase